MIIALRRYLIFSVFQNSVLKAQLSFPTHRSFHPLQARTIYVIFYRINFQSWVFEMFIQKKNSNFILRLQF